MFIQTKIKLLTPRATITYTPDTRAPARIPDRFSTPNKVPKMRCVSITSQPGGIISFSKALVDIFIQVP